LATLDLRPLSLGELLDRTFFLYRRHFLLFVGIAAIPYSFFFVINLATALVPIFAGSDATGRVPPAGIAAAAIGGGLFALVAVFAGGVAFLFSVGATVFAVSEIYTGRQTTIRESLSRVRGKTWTIFGVLFLSGLIIVGGFIALIIPGIYLMCRICVATPAALLEDIGPSDSIRRTFDLTRNFAGRAFMIYLLYFAMVWGVVAVFQFPFMLLLAVSAKQMQLRVLLTVLMQVGNFIGSVLVAPVSTIGFALFYYDLRVRKEAFDLQMMMQAIGADPMHPPITGGVPSMFGRDAS
jgi:MFS family permease